MQRVRLDVLVTAERIRLRAVIEEYARRIEVSEEACEGERLEAVRAVRVCARSILPEQLAQAVGLPKRRRLEHVQLGI